MAITRGERAKAAREEAPERCLCVPAGLEISAPCSLDLGHTGPHSWEHHADAYRGRINAPITEPGIYPDLDFESYCRIDAVNSHLLGGFASGTPAHVRHALLHGGQEPTPSLDLGWLVHLAVLEPDRFEREVAVPPRVDRRTKAGRVAWAEWEAAHPGTYNVSAEDHAAALAMRAALYSHPTAGAFFLGPGRNEVSAVWIDPATEVRCKARIDRIGTIGEWPVIGDLKTARRADRRSFERAILAYAYHVQGAHYSAGLEALRPVPAGNPFRRFVFFVVESAPPYPVACYELDEAALAQAETDRQRYLRTWRRCHETDSWPAYGDGIDYASLPPWAFRISTDVD